MANELVPCSEGEYLSKLMYTLHNLKTFCKLSFFFHLLSQLAAKGGVAASTLLGPNHDDIMLQPCAVFLPYCLFVYTDTNLLLLFYFCNAGMVPKVMH